MNIKNIIEEKLSEVILNVFQLKDITLEVQENKTEFERRTARCRIWSPAQTLAQAW